MNRSFSTEDFGERFSPPENPNIESTREYTCFHHPAVQITQTWRLVKRGPNPGGFWVPQFCDDCIADSNNEPRRAIRENKQHVLQMHIETSRVPKLYQTNEKSIDSYPPKSDEQRDYVNAFRRWVSQMERHWILYAYGDNGVGKSHLAMSAISLAAHQGKTARYWTASELIYAALDAMHNDVEREFLDHVAEVQFLAIDELGGTEKASNYSMRVLTYVIDKRVREELPTLVVSNHSPMKLASVLCPNDSDVEPADVMRLMDRITDARVSRVLQMKGSSHRQEVEMIGGRRAR